MNDELIERVARAIARPWMAEPVNFRRTLHAKAALAALKAGDEIGDDLTVVKTYSHRSARDMKKMGEEEMRERCAKLADEAGPVDCSYLAIAIRALK